MLKNRDSILKPNKGRYTVAKLIVDNNETSITFRLTCDLPFAQTIRLLDLPH